MPKGKHIITSPIEHKAIIDTARWLERQGCEVTWLPVGTDGLIDPADVRRRFARHHPRKSDARQ